MNKKSSLLLVLVICFLQVTLSGQPKDNWYRFYSGSIGKYPVAVNLHKFGNTYAGYYYYNSSQHPIYISATDSGKTKGVNFWAHVPGDNFGSETFKLDLAPTKITGQWWKDEKSKPLPVVLNLVNESPEFQVIYSEDEKKLRPKMKESPRAYFRAASVWPSGMMAAANDFRILLNRQYGVENSMGDIGKEFLKQRDAFFRQYMEDMKEVVDSELVDYPQSYSQEEETWTLVSFRNDRIINFATWNYSYMGGAHGNYSTSYVVADIVMGTKINLENILTSAGIKKLGPLLEKYFRKQSRLVEKASLTEEGGLFSDQIEPNENFFMTGKGIGFSYSPYEIAPYALGEISIFIPHAELTAYLKPAYKNYFK